MSIHGKIAKSRRSNRKMINKTKRVVKRVVKAATRKTKAKNVKR